MSAVIPNWLTAPLVPLAWCWRIERHDGVTLGLTTHDRDLVIGGLSYKAAPGIRPTAIRQRMGLSGDRMDIEGALSNAAIDAGELFAGRWNGARLTLLIADWEAPDARQLVIAEGALGEVAVQGQQFVAELRGVSDRLDMAAVPSTSASCRAALGDPQCGVALPALTVRRMVTAVAGETVTVADAPPGLAYGRLRWLSGPARGLTATIIAQVGGLLTLAEPVPGGVAVGTTVELIAGCDKRLETCRTRFANSLNFRGEPHLPGIDLLTRYPGG